MAISVTVNKQNIKYDKLIANKLHLMPLGIRTTQICTDIVPRDEQKYNCCNYIRYVAENF